MHTPGPWTVDEFYEMYDFIADISETQCLIGVECKPSAPACDPCRARALVAKIAGQP